MNKTTISIPKIVISLVYFVLLGAAGLNRSVDSLTITYTLLTARPRRLWSRSTGRSSACICSRFAKKHKGLPVVHADLLYRDRASAIGFIILWPRPDNAILERNSASLHLFIPAMVLA